MIFIQNVGKTKDGEEVIIVLLKILVLAAEQGGEHSNF